MEAFVAIVIAVAVILFIILSIIYLIEISRVRPLIYKLNSIFYDRYDSKMKVKYKINNTIIILDFYNAKIFISIKPGRYSLLILNHGVVLQDEYIEYENGVISKIMKVLVKK